MIALLPRHAVIGLMFEAWEFRGADLDLAACRERGIRVAAVNERHPDVGVFPFLGPLCVRLLAEAGITRPGSRVALLCDNPFAPFIMAGLTEAGFRPALHETIAAVPSAGWDAVVVALDPARNAPLDEAATPRTSPGVAGRARARPVLGRHRPRSRRQPRALRDPVPATAPGPGHMGILLNALGPEPIVRLQAGGLKAAEFVFGGNEACPAASPNCSDQTIYLQINLEAVGCMGFDQSINRFRAARGRVLSAQIKSLARPSSAGRSPSLISVAGRTTGKTSISLECRTLNSST